MAREKAILARGDAFPELELSLSTGERIVFPGGSGGKWTALLFYCGSGCARCLEQLASFRKDVCERRRENVRFLAVSGADREQTMRTMWDLQIPFPVAYLEDAARARNGLGAVYDREREEMHPRVYLVDPEGKIASTFNGSLPADWLRQLAQHPSQDNREDRKRPVEIDNRYSLGGPVRQLTRLQPR